MSSLKVNETMTRFPEVAFPGTTVTNAIAAMEKWGIRHLPVVDNKKVVGIVSQRDLVAQPGDQLLREIMVTTIYKVSPNAYLHDVVYEMAQKKYGCAVIINDNEEIVGIFTTVDALYLLNRLLASDRSPKTRMCQINFQNPEYML